jgi:hypothetical protein
MHIPAARAPMTCSRARRLTSRYWNTVLYQRLGAATPYQYISSPCAPLCAANGNLLPPSFPSCLGASNPHEELLVHDGALCSLCFLRVNNSRASTPLQACARRIHVTFPRQWQCAEMASSSRARSSHAVFGRCSAPRLPGAYALHPHATGACLHFMPAVAREPIRS